MLLMVGNICHALGGRHEEAACWPGVEHDGCAGNVRDLHGPGRARSSQRERPLVLLNAETAGRDRAAIPPQPDRIGLWGRDWCGRATEPTPEAQGHGSASVGVTRLLMGTETLEDVRQVEPQLPDGAVGTHR